MRERTLLWMYLSYTYREQRLRKKNQKLAFPRECFHPVEYRQATIYLDQELRNLLRHTAQEPTAPEPEHHPATHPHRRQFGWRRCSGRGPHGVGELADLLNLYRHRLACRTANEAS